MEARPTTSMKKGWLCRTSYDEKNNEIAPVMFQIQWWWPVMIQIQWWWSSSDDPDPVMMSNDDPDPVMMIQIEWWSRFGWRWHEHKYDLEMQMTRRSREEYQWLKLWWENTFLFKRECWCNCNFGMYSLVFLIYCNPIFIPGFYHVMSCPDVSIGRINIVNKSCQVIVGNPPIF